VRFLLIYSTCQRNVTSGWRTSGWRTVVRTRRTLIDCIESLECRKGTQKTCRLQRKTNNNKTNWWAIKAKVW